MTELISHPLFFLLTQCVLFTMHSVCFLLRTVSVSYYAQCLFLTTHSVCFLLCTVCVSYYAQCVFLTMHNSCFLSHHIILAVFAEVFDCDNPDSTPVLSAVNFYAIKIDNVKQKELSNTAT